MENANIQNGLQEHQCTMEIRVAAYQNKIAFAAFIKTA